MKVLVTFAVEAEFAPWRALREFKKVRVNEKHYSGGVDVYETRVVDSTVWVVLTGIGIKFFDFEAASCLVDAGVDAIISSGLAGSLKPECVPEEIIAPKRIVSLRGATGAAVTTGLLMLAQEMNAKVVGTMITVDHIVETAGEKKRLSIFGEAVDMESFHVMTGFESNRIPVVTIRAISDAYNEDLPLDFVKCLTPQGAVKPGAVLGHLFRNPTKIPALILFGQQSKAAARKLALFLDGFVKRLTPERLKLQPVEVEAN
jgi:nucleoside phosphorylase